MKIRENMIYYVEDSVVQPVYNFHLYMENEIKIQKIPSSMIELETSVVIKYKQPEFFNTLSSEHKCFQITEKNNNNEYFLRLKCSTYQSQYAYKSKESSSLNLLKGILDDNCFQCESKIGMYYNKQYKKCSNCINNCQICLNDHKCLQCSQNYHFADNQCQPTISESILNYCREQCKCNYLNNWECIQCQTECQQLIDSQKSVYQKNNLIIKSKLNKRNLLTCCSNCSICGTSTLCNGCISGYFLQFTDSTQTANVCNQCITNCSICINTTNCSICNTSYYVDNTGTCVQCNSTGQSISSDQRSCIQCSSNCSACSSTTVCTSCATPYQLYTDQTGAVTCIQCSSHCSTCSSTTVCLSCILPYYLYQSNCIQCSQYCSTCSSTTVCLSCNSQYYLYSDSANNTAICILCSSNCSACSSTTVCLTCDPGYYLYNNASNNTATCILCSSNCTACSSTSVCLTCDPGYYLYNNASNNTATCILCSSNCAACSSTSVCTQCSGLYYLYQDQSNNTGTCVLCSQNCSACSSNSICISCNSPYYLYSDSINNTATCILCSSNCVTCSSTTTCTQCSSTYFLDQSGQSIICQQCDSQCIGCSSDSNKNCVSCSSLYYLNSDTSCQPCSSSSIQQSIVSVLQNRCQNSQILCQFNKSSSQYENTLMCNKCYSEYSLVNNACITSCSDIGSNFVYDQNTNSCICSSQYPYLLVTNTNQQICSNTILPGYYCDSSNNCYQCISNCDTCDNQRSCNVCSVGYYQWLNQCASSCNAFSNVTIDSSGKKCICLDNYIYREQQNQCILVLKVVSVTYSMGSQYNIITVQLNRAPLSDELQNLGLLFDPSRLTDNIDYTIVSRQIVDDQIIYEVQVQINTKINAIYFSINSQTMMFNVQNTILVTQTYIKSQYTQSAASAMDSSSSKLTSQDGLVGNTVMVLKNLQLLGAFSNFVQIYGSLIVFYGKESTAVFIGQIFGASFIFKNIPSYEVIMDESLENGTLTTEQYIFEKLGLTTDIYKDFIFPHLFIQLAVFINFFCFFARQFVKGKQHSIAVINYFVNLLYSLQQGFITSSLFSIFCSLKYGQQKYMAIFQLAIHIIFFIQMTVYVLKRKSGYVEINLPNMVLNINPKMKGWKSYFILTYLKKYACILLILSFNNPLVISISVAVIFILFAAYLAYFRFFTHYIFNLIKPIQELLIGISFIILAMCISKYNQIINSLTISDEELLVINKLSFIVMIMFTSCMIVSTLIYIIRLGFNIHKIYQQIIVSLQKRKQDKEISEGNFSNEIFNSLYDSKELQIVFSKTNTKNNNTKINTTLVTSTVMQKFESKNNI